MSEQEYEVYTARINVIRVYEIEIVVPKTEDSEDIAVRAACNADTMFVHKHGRLEAVEVDYVEVESSDRSPETAKIRVEAGVDPNDAAFHIEQAGHQKLLVFGKEAPPYDGILWEDKL